MCKFLTIGLSPMSMTPLTHGLIILKIDRLSHWQLNPGSNPAFRGSEKVVII
jgi:hypothetical protein